MLCCRIGQLIHEAPRQVHLQVVKRVIRYIKGTKILLVYFILYLKRLRSLDTQTMIGWRFRREEEHK